jgi:quinol monooxygenase YgiN
MVTVVYIVKIDTANIEYVRPVANTLVEHSRKEQKVTSYDLLQDTQNPGTFMFVAHYASLEAFHDHQANEVYKNANTSVAQWLLSPPDIPTLHMILYIPNHIIGPINNKVISINLGRAL